MISPEVSLQELEQEISGLKSESESIYARKTERIKRDLTEKFLENLFIVAERIERAKISSYLSQEELDTLSVQLDAISLKVTDKLMLEHYDNFDDKFLPFFIEKRKYKLVDSLGDNSTSFIYARPATDGVLAVSKKKNGLANVSVKHFSPDANGFGSETDFYIDNSFKIGKRIRCLQRLTDNEYLIAGTACIIKFTLAKLDSWEELLPGDSLRFDNGISAVQPMEDGSMLIGCEDGELYECNWDIPSKPELIYKSDNTISGIELAGDGVFVSDGYSERNGKPPFLLKRLYRNGGKWDIETISERRDTCFRKIQSTSEDSVLALRWGGIDEYTMDKNGQWKVETVLTTTDNFSDVQFLPSGKFLWSLENVASRASFGFRAKGKKGSLAPVVTLNDRGKVVPLRDGKLVVIADDEMRLYDGEV